jgi:hypothetical protein
MPIISAAREAEIAGSQVPAQSGQRGEVLPQK